MTVHNLLQPPLPGILTGISEVGRAFEVASITSRSSAT
jgi:hypothetical protein